MMATAIRYPDRHLSHGLPLLSITLVYSFLLTALYWCQHFVIFALDGVMPGLPRFSVKVIGSLMHCVCVLILLILELYTAGVVFVVR